MNITQHMAKHFHDVHFGGNWTTTNVYDILKDVTLSEALAHVESCNTIATLAFHINYFVLALNQVLRGEHLTANDTFSFSHPTFSSPQDWQNFLDKIFDDAREAVALIELLPENNIFEPFFDTKYGNYYRNINGIIEHTHYHLGQIVLIKKLLRA